MSATVWDGSWVLDRAGIELEDDAGPHPLRELIGLALRHNPRRAHLLVSHVLGKHIPAEPARVLGAGRELAELVGGVLNAPAGLVLGYAETATGLGHAVAHTVRAPCLHSTRRLVAGYPPAAGFTEDHSHASEHALSPRDPRLLLSPEPIVLVDDELSTGRTILNTIRALEQLARRPQYVVAALVDVRGADEQVTMAQAAAELDTQIDVVSLASGRICLDDEAVTEARKALETSESGCSELVYPRAPVVSLDGVWPGDVPVTGRHGWSPADDEQARAACVSVAGRVGELLVGDRVLVLGTEELMYVPTLIADALTLSAPSCAVRVSSTTRSPVAVVDQPGYAVRSALRFPAHDHPADEARWRYAYNLGPTLQYTDIVVVLDRPADTGLLRIPGGLLFQLAGRCDRVIAVVIGR